MESILAVVILFIIRLVIPITLVLLAGSYLSDRQSLRD